jgi:protocatechuate 3,4-dioxygenase beta subunit
MVTRILSFLFLASLWIAQPVNSYAGADQTRANPAKVEQVGAPYPTAKAIGARQGDNTQTDNSAQDYEAALTRDAYSKHCELTPPNKSPMWPGTKYIYKGNNLVQPAGKSQSVPGQFLYVTGRIFDENCVPLKNAKVQLWQANSEGKYIYPHGGSFANPYPLFAGSGTTYTDNRGRFKFHTVFPGPFKDRAPKLAFRVTHADTVPLFSTIYFEGDVRNQEDKYYRRVPSDLKPLVTATTEPLNTADINQGIHAHIDMTVKGSDPFRSLK